SSRMPPSTPTASMSPGRLAMLEPANTPLRKMQLQQEQEIVKVRYLWHTIVSASVLAASTTDCLLLNNSLLHLLLHLSTNGRLGEATALYLHMTLILVSLVWSFLSGFHYIFPESEGRGGRVGGGSEQLSKKSTVLTSTPAFTGTTPPMTPQREGEGGREDHGLISPIFPIPENTIFGTPQQSPPVGLRNRRVDYRPLYGASSPSRPDLSWIDEHEFGGAKGGAAAANRSALSLSARSHSASFASGPSSPASLGAGLISDLASSAPFQARVAALPSTKMLNSIHTQEQVDALLSKSRADAAAAAATGGAGDKLNQSTSFYQAMLQLDGLELHPYQMSKEPIEKKADPYDVVYDANGSVHLSPRVGSAGTSPSGSDDTSRFRVELAAQRAAAAAAASAAGGASPIDGRRRRLSHHLSASPSRVSGTGGGEGGERGTGGSGGVRRKKDSHSSLSESELTRAEQRLRIWIVNTIVRPVHEGIKAINKRFETDLAALHLRIGTSTVDQITAALTAHPELVQTTLPYLMPYLRVTTNQAYLVSRLSDLSVGSCMADFSWASGGPQPTEGTEKVSTSPLTARMAARPWNDSLPTDTQLVLSLFCAYMDTRVTSCAIVQGHNVDQPFSSRYTLVAPNKPTALHQGGEAFYVHLSSLNPPSLEFVSVAVDSQAAITTRSLFRALVLFLAHAAYENEGKIDILKLNSPALKLDMVLNGY
ncbi:hypothetical protein PMAYCL1PPCAC_11045, partial [Pristionchus mayeri]